MPYRQCDTHRPFARPQSDFNLSSHTYTHRTWKRCLGTSPPNGILMLAILAKLAATTNASASASSFSSSRSTATTSSSYINSNNNYSLRDDSILSFVPSDKLCVGEYLSVKQQQLASSYSSTSTTTAMPPHVRQHKRSVLPPQRQNQYTTPITIARPMQVSGTKPGLIVRSIIPTFGVPSSASITTSTTTVTDTTAIATATSTNTPATATDFPRPITKPRLLTDYEYETMWNPVPNTLRIGIVLALSASNQTLQATLVRKGLSAIRLAVEDVNRLKMIPGINVSLIVRDSLDPSLFTNTGGLAAITATGDLMSAKVGGVIGDISSAVTRFEALITSSVDLWQCSYASVDTLLSDISTYPSFFRTVPTIFLEIDAILHMAVHLGWKRILIIYDMVSLGWTGREYIAAKASQLGIYILGYQPLSPDGVTVDPTYQAVKEGIRSYQSRVQVVITNGIEQLPLIREMSDSGFFGPDYGWVTLSDISFLMQQDKNIRNYDGMIMVDNGWDLNGYGPFDTFQEEWVALNATDYPGAGDPQLSRNEGMAYSCVMMFAEAYGKLVRASTSNTSNLIQDIISGAHTGQINMSQTFGNMSYEGPSGPITLDSNGDRTSGNYVMMTMYNGTAVLFASSLSGDYVQSRPPLFKEGYPDLPNDTPLGAIQNPRWDNVNGIIYGVFCILGILLTLAAMMAVIYFRKHIVLKAASPIFCLYELFGVLLIIVWCTLHVGIPNEAVCIVQAFNLPLGVTFLAGSLTIKNYRIYRIFNSVTATNLAFQTRVLIRYLGLAVVLCLIPVIVQVIVDPPSPQKLNIQSYQWIRCTGTYAQTIWTVLNSIVPMALLFFGVFLAIKTRNVVFLWNEARQISLVLYNVSFFAILVIISRIFPPSLYPANFYIASIGALFVVLVTLIVLFAPKFWNIWNDLHKGRGKERYYNNFNNRTPHLGIRGAGGSDDHSITVGPGGLGGDASGAIFGRMPEDLKFALPPTVQPTTEGEQQEQQRQQQEEVASTNSAVGDFDLSNIAFDRSELGASSHEPSATTTVERVPAIATTTEVSRSESRSESHPESLSSFSDIINRRQAKSKDNPLNAWMKSRIPRKESVVVGNTHKIDEVETLQNQGGAEEQRSVHEPNSSGAGHLESEAAASAGVSVVAMATTAEYAPEGPLNVDTQSGSVFEGASLGASNILDSYVFLLPIFVIRNRIARILSHWSMTTIILIPEAHAFLAVDSTNGRSTSYLMLSMTQVESEDEPMIQITTCHAGTLLIRFSNQARLDYWRNLFSQSDLQALNASTFSAPTPASAPIPPGTAAYSSSSSYSSSPFISGFGGYSDHNSESTGTGVRRRSAAKALNPSINRVQGGTGHQSIFRPRSTELSPTIEMMQRDVSDSDSEFKERNVMTSMTDQSQGCATHPPGLDPRDGLLRPKTGITDSDSTGNGINSYNAGIFENQNPLMIGTCNVARDRANIESEEQQATASSAIEIIVPPHLDQAKTSVSPLASTGPIDPLALCQYQPNSDGHIGNHVEEDSDSDDLYDPEFGIGGNGRRRRKNRHHRGPIMRPPPFPSNAVSTPTQGHPIIPSAAVISAAAAAVSAGWSESDALTAAMADPSVFHSQIDPLFKPQSPSQTRRSSQASTVTANHSRSLTRLFNRQSRRESSGTASVQTNASSNLWSRSWGSTSSRGTTFSERVKKSSASNMARAGSYSSAASTSNPMTPSVSLPMTPLSAEDTTIISQGSRE